MILTILILLAVGWFFRAWGSKCIYKARWYGGAVIDPGLNAVGLILAIFGSLLWLAALVVLCVIVWRYLP